MIYIKLDETTLYDEINNEFIYLEEKVVGFEYSLKAIYEWESIYKKIFLSSEVNKSTDELIDLIVLMANAPINRSQLSSDNIKAISEYILDSQTATTFSDIDEESKSMKQYSSEQIYAFMFMNSIPLEWENRNLNRLMVVLRIIGIYNSPKKKMTNDEIMLQNRNLNELRKKQFNSRG